MNTKIDITDVELHTERLLLRPFRLSDLDDFYAYASVDGVGQMAGWMPHENREKSLQILNIFIEGKKTFALVKDGKVIGSLGIEKYPENLYPEFGHLKCRELGFVLAKPYWGQGLMMEAVNEVIRYCFEDLKLDALFCGYFTWNRQSARVQEKCGFQHWHTRTFQTRMGTEETARDNVLLAVHWEKQ